MELQVAPRLVNLAVTRTLIGAVGEFHGLDADTVADLRLAVDEACTVLVCAASREAALTIVVQPGDDAIAVHASTACHDGSPELHRDTVPWLVLTALADEVKTVRGGRRPGGSGGTMGITLTMHRPGPRRSGGGLADTAPGIRPV